MNIMESQFPGAQYNWEPSVPSVFYNDLPHQDESRNEADRQSEVADYNMIPAVLYEDLFTRAPSQTSPQDSYTHPCNHLDTSAASPEMASSQHRSIKRDVFSKNEASSVLNSSSPVAEIGASGKAKEVQR